MEKDLTYSSGDDGDRASQLIKIAMAIDKRIKPAARPPSIIFNREDAPQRIINLPGSEFHDKGLESKTSKGKVYYLLQKNLLGNDPAKKEIALSILKQEFKIHLMPKAEYVPAVSSKIFEIMAEETSKEYLSGIKIKLDPDPKRFDGGASSHEENLGIFVLYPLLGRRTAERMLQRLIDAFSEEDHAEIGLGITPRFNLCVSNLIYYAQGAGDLKETLTKQQRTIFNEDLTLFKDENPLNYTFKSRQRQRKTSSSHPKNNLKFIEALERLEVGKALTFYNELGGTQALLKMAMQEINDGSSEFAVRIANLIGKFDKKSSGPKIIADIIKRQAKKA